MELGHIFMFWESNIKKNISTKLLLFLFLFTLGGNFELYSQRKEFCTWCNGKGKLPSSSVCPNCEYWTKYQKKVNPCKVCKNTSWVKNGKFDVCYCKGKGYFIIYDLLPKVAKVKQISNPPESYDEIMARNRTIWYEFEEQIINEKQINFKHRKTGLNITFFENGNVKYFQKKAGKEIILAKGNYVLKLGEIGYYKTTIIEAKIITSDGVIRIFDSSDMTNLMGKEIVEDPFK